MDYYFFDEDTYTKIEILEKLSMADEWKKTRELADEIGTGERYIFRQINDLTVAIGKLNNKNFTLSIKQGRGIRLENTDTKAYKNFVSKLIEKSFTMKLLRKLLEKGKVLNTLLLSEFFLSETTLKRKIKRINSFLIEYDTRIVTRKGFCFIEGDEYSVRAGYYRIYWQIYKNLDWPFKMIEKEKVSAFVNKLACSYNIRLNPSAKLQVMFVLAINSLRYRGKNRIEIYPKYRAYFNITKSLHIFPEINLAWKYTFHMGQDEFCFFLLYLQTRQSFYTNQEIFNNLFRLHESYETEAYRQMGASLREFNKISVHKDQYVTIKSALLAGHLHAELFPTIKKDISGFEPKGISQESYQWSQKIVEKIANNEDNKVLTSGGESYLLSVYVILLDSVYISDIQERKKIYLDTDLPFLEEKRLSGRIQQMMEVFLPITVEKYTEQNINENQLLLSNNCLSDEVIDRYSNQIVFISNEFTFEDLQKCVSAFRELFFDRANVASAII
jgi:hypothetical protein